MTRSPPRHLLHLALLSVLSTTTAPLHAADAAADAGAAQPTTLDKVEVSGSRARAHGCR